MVMDEELRRLLRRAEVNGILATKPSSLTRSLSKKNSNLLVFNNRRLNKSVVVNLDHKKIREILGL